MRGTARHRGVETGYSLCRRCRGYAPGAPARTVHPPCRRVSIGRYHYRMGLDGVEIAMAVEDRFRITLPDAEYSNVRTVADLAALVISRLPRAGGFCPAARLFLRVRGILAQECGLDRRTLRPGTPLEMVFPPRKRRSRWKSLANAERNLPRLRLTGTARRVFRALGLFLFFLWASWSVLMLVDYGVPGGVLSAFPLVGGAVAIAVARARWANEFPAGCETLGDLVRTIAPDSIPSDAGRRLLYEQRILDQVQTITAETLGLKREKVTPESRFQEDLAVG